MTQPILGTLMRGKNLTRDQMQHGPLNERANSALYPVAAWLLVAVAFWPWQVGGIPPHAVAWISATVLAVAVVVDGRLAPRSLTLLRWYLLFLAFLGLSLTRSDDFRQGMQFFVQMTAPAIAFAASFAVRGDMVDRLIIRVRSVAMALVSTSSLLLVAAFVAGVLSVTNVGLGISRQVAISLTLASAVAVTGRRGAIVWTILIGTLVVQVILGNRIGMVASSAVLLLSPATRLSRVQKTVLASAAIVAFGVLLQTAPFQNRFFFAGSEGTLGDLVLVRENVNTQGRLTLWENLTSDCGTSPLIGLGTGDSFAASRTASRGVLDQPHNEFIRIYCEVGLLGSSLFWSFWIGLAISGVSTERRLRRLGAPARLRDLARMTVTVSVVFTVFALTDNIAVYSGYFMIPAFVTLALVHRMISLAYAQAGIRPSDRRGSIRNKLVYGLERSKRDFRRVSR